MAVSYSGVPTGLSSKLFAMGWQKVDDTIFTLDEPQGAATWFPVNDTPADKATYTFHLTVPKPYTATANGVLADTRAEGDGPNVHLADGQADGQLPGGGRRGAVRYRDVHVRRRGDHQELLCDRCGRGRSRRLRPHRRSDRLLRRSVRSVSLRGVRRHGAGRGYRRRSHGEPDAVTLRPGRRHQAHVGSHRRPHLPLARTGPPVVREQRHHRAVGRHLVERRVLHLCKLAVVGARPGTASVGSSGEAEPPDAEQVDRAAPGRARGGRHVRGECVPARAP